MTPDQMAIVHILESWGRPMCLVDLRRCLDSMYCFDTSPAVVRQELQDLARNGIVELHDGEYQLRVSGGLWVHQEPLGPRVGWYDLTDHQIVKEIVEKHTDARDD